MRARDRTRPFQGNNSFTFFHGVNVIDGEILQGFNSAGGPADLNTFRLVRVSQPEVDPHIILREEAASAADFIHLRHRPGNGLYPRSDSLTVRLAEQLQSEPMVLVAAVIAKKVRHAGASGGSMWP